MIKAKFAIGDVAELRKPASGWKIGSPHRIKDVKWMDGHKDPKYHYWRYNTESGLSLPEEYLRPLRSDNPVVVNARQQATIERLTAENAELAAALAEERAHADGLKANIVEMQDKIEAHRFYSAQQVGHAASLRHKQHRAATEQDGAARTTTAATTGGDGDEQQ